MNFGPRPSFGMGGEGIKTKSARLMISDANHRIRREAIRQTSLAKVASSQSTFRSAHGAGELTCAVVQDDVRYHSCIILGIILISC